MSPFFLILEMVFIMKWFINYVGIGAISSLLKCSQFWYIIGHLFQSA